MIENLKENTNMDIERRIQISEADSSPTRSGVDEPISYPETRINSGRYTDEPPTAIAP